MGENKDDRLDRKKKERAEYLRQQAQQEKADAELAAELDKDPRFAADFEASIQRSTDELSDAFLDKFARDKGYSKAETEAMKKTVKKAREKAQGTLFGKADPAAAEKILMSSRGIREARKHKNKKGCAVITVLLLSIGASTVGAVLYGAAEILAAVAR